MFGPNVIPAYHHRSDKFHTLYESTEKLFRRQFSIGPDFDLIFMTGSGALALEACIASLNYPLRVEHTGGKFGKRLEAVSNHYKEWLPLHGDDPLGLVFYETSNSTLSAISLDKLEAARVVLMDCVSSFPFYPIHEQADIWVTVTGKQLRCPAGLAIIGVRKTLWGSYLTKDPDHPSYLNLSRYHEFSLRYETPTTPSILGFESLHEKLEFTIFESQKLIIQRRWEELCQLCGTPPGQSPPVYTFPGLVTDVHKAFGLYGSDQTQVFLYAGIEQQFQALMKALAVQRSVDPDATYWWHK